MNWPVWKSWYDVKDTLLVRLVLMYTVWLFASDRQETGSDSEKCKLPYPSISKYIQVAVAEDHLPKIGWFRDQNDQPAEVLGP